MRPRGARRRFRLNARCTARGGVLALAVLAIAALLAPGAGRADERRSRSHRTQLVVVDYPHGAFVDPELHAAVRELLSRLQVQVVSATQAAGGEVIAYVRIEVGSDAVNVSVEDARGRAPAVRRSVLRGDSDAMLRETVAHVLLGLVEPLAEADRPLATQGLRDQGDASSRWGAAAPQLGLHGGPVQLAQASWSGRFVASGALVWEGRFSPALALDASAALPVGVDEQDIEVRVLLGGARARARFTPLSFERAALDGALSVGADVLSVRPEAAPQGTELTARASRRAQPVLGVALSARSRVHARLELVLGVGIDFDLMPRRWSVEEGTSSSEIFATHFIRPYATLGVDWLLRAPASQPEGPTAP